MSTITSPVSVKNRLLDAAERLVAKTGTSNLTLDAIAQAADVSKGGLLYHYPSKEALLEGMIERHLSELEARVATACAAKDAPRNALLGARVLALLDVVPTQRSVGAALLAASATNPLLMTRCRAHYARIVKSLEELPCSFEQAALVLLAVDGLVLGEIMQLSPFTTEQRQRVVAALIERASACESATPPEM